jgi:hypothetical protein
VSFDPPCYVNLLRNYINENFHSSCGEITREKSSVIKINGDICDTPFISITKGVITATIIGSMFRLQFKCGTQGAKAEIVLDGILIEEICTFYEGGGSYDYRIRKYDGFQDVEHVLEIRLKRDGQLDLYRIDYYRELYAVINSGVGSCDSGKYLKEYWRNYVEDYRPSCSL